MGYLHIQNLYKEQTILLFKECYALEKIHGTSAHIGYNSKDQRVFYFSGGENAERFKSLFDDEALAAKFKEIFTENVKIYGEVYGGKQQGMKDTYGTELKFVAFDVNVDDKWLNVPNAESVCKMFGIEFVDYVKISTDLPAIDAERDKDSTQAIRNGVGTGKIREGVVLRPLIEVTLNNGERIISKHKRDEFRETTSLKKVVDPALMEVLKNAQNIANEWVTEMRLTHVLDKFPELDLKYTGQVIAAMTEDIYREAKGEIIESKEVARYIGTETAKMFKKRICTV